MRRVLPACAAICLLGGCGQYYILTAPDVIAVAGGEAVAVARLQRYDPYPYAPGLKDAAMRFRVGEGTERGAYTDPLGYAGVPLPVPAEPGAYPLTVSHMDRDGDEISLQVGLFAWKPDRPAVVVDMDCLPRKGAADLPAARTAIDAMSRTAHVAYLTRTDVREHPAEHRRLRELGYPDGPVLLWQREYWHVIRDPKLRYMPRVVVETRLVSQTAELRKTFPRLETGVCASEVAARAFQDAGLKCVIVGKAAEKLPKVTRRASWADLSAGGL
jgi:hypothetical protein